VTELTPEATLLTFPQPPDRVVSLVPSITESLFDLGAGGAVVGVTDYCVHPANSLGGIPRIGGTRNPRVSEIIELEPDLVLANQEENSPGSVEGLREAGIPVWLAFPRTVRQAYHDLTLLARLFHSATAYARLETLERALEWAEADSDSLPKRRYFCPIWQHQDNHGGGWWMTFNRNTYASDLLRLFGGENVFADRERRYPLSADLAGTAGEAAEERDTRYPRVTSSEVSAEETEFVLLPDEPFHFYEEEQTLIADQLGYPSGGDTPKFVHLDGSLLFWHGTRMGLALRELADLFS
jgi:hypothetical protein